MKQLPFAILPAKAGQRIGPATAQARVDDDGGLYAYWMPGDPLRALSYPTHIENADIIFRRTQDRSGLEAQLPSVNLAADYLSALTTEEGVVKGAGYYVEMPTKIEFYGVTQCHAMDAVRWIAALIRVVGDEGAAKNSWSSSFVRQAIWATPPMPDVITALIPHCRTPCRDRVIASASL